jgi:hypothetical protein
MTYLIPFASRLVAPCASPLRRSMNIEARTYISQGLATCGGSRYYLRALDKAFTRLSLMKLEKHGRPRPTPRCDRMAWRNSLLIGPKVHRLAEDPKMRLKEDRGGCKLTVIFGCEMGEESDANVCSQFGAKAAEIAVDDAEVEGRPRDVRRSGRDIGPSHQNGTSAVGFAKMNHHPVIRALSSSCIRGSRRERGQRFKGRCISSIAFDSPERFGYGFGVNGLSLKRFEIAASGVIGRRCPALHLDDL